MPYDKVLDVPWHAYRTWAATARFLKSDLTRFTRHTLILAIAGAILAATGQELSPWPKFSRAAALLASFALALAAYFGKQALTASQTSDWVKARSAAESLKAATYLYRASAPPFDQTDRMKALSDLVATIERRVESLQARSPANEESPDLSPLTVDDYIQKRVEDQIDYYDKRAAQYQKNNDTLSAIVFWFGAASVLLGLVSTLVGFVPAIIGLIATLTASLSAHAQNQQYQVLIVTCQATSRRLVALIGQWAASGKTDADTTDRNAFVRACEDTLAQESTAWVGQWTKQ
jgi:hypothetical protein